MGSKTKRNSSRAAKSHIFKKKKQFLCQISTTCVQPLRQKDDDEVISSQIAQNIHDKQEPQQLEMSTSKPSENISEIKKLSKPFYHQLSLKLFQK